MPKFSRRRAVVLVLAIVVGVAAGRRLLREPPSEGEVVLTAELFWVPASSQSARSLLFTKDGKTLAVRVRNDSAATAKLFDLSGRYASEGVSVHTLADGLIVEPELQDHLGQPILAGPHANVMPRSHFDGNRDVANARPVYELGPWQVGVPDRLGRHFAGKPPAFDFAPGQSLDVPLNPFPMYVQPTELGPSLLTVVALVTWLDATTQEKRQFRSQPLSFELTAEDIARGEAEYEAHKKTPGYHGFKK